MRSIHQAGHSPWYRQLANRAHGAWTRPEWHRVAMLCFWRQSTGRLLTAASSALQIPTLRVFVWKRQCKRRLKSLNLFSRSSPEERLAPFGYSHMMIARTGCSWLSSVDPLPTTAQNISWLTEPTISSGFISQAGTLDCLQLFHAPGCYHKLDKAS